MFYGCRIPCKYLVTSGIGQSSAQAGADHFETSAYDIALLDAGIENFNIMIYTSVLPPESSRITMEDAKAQELFHHGAVLETIKAELDGVKGEYLCTGVGTCHVREYQEMDGSYILIGGFAAEYEGNSSEEYAAKVLHKDLEGIFARRYGDDPHYEMVDVDINTRAFVVDEDYGVCFTALCFLTYKIPAVIGP